MRIVVVDKLVILMCCVWMIYEFGQGICVCMLTYSIDNFYGFLEILPMGIVRFVDMFYEFLCLEVLFVFLLIGLIFLMIFDDK